MALTPSNWYLVASDTWLVLIVSGTMLTVVFGRAVKVATRPPAAVTTDALARR